MAVLVREPQSGCLCDLGSATGVSLEVQQDAKKVSLLRSRELSEVWLPIAVARASAIAAGHLTRDVSGCAGKKNLRAARATAVRTRARNSCPPVSNSAVS